jgi:hypothetical protein
MTDSARSGPRPAPAAKPPEFAVCPLMCEIKALGYFWPIRCGEGRSCNLYHALVRPEGRVQDVMRRRPNLVPAGHRSPAANIPPPRPCARKPRRGGGPVKSAACGGVLMAGLKPGRGSPSLKSISKILVGCGRRWVCGQRRAFPRLLRSKTGEAQPVGWKADCPHIHGCQARVLHQAGRVCGSGGRSRVRYIGNGYPQGGAKS